MTSNCLIVRNSNTVKRGQDIVQGHPILVTLGGRKITAYTEQPYNGQKIMVLHNRKDTAKITVKLFLVNGALHGVQL